MQLWANVYAADGTTRLGDGPVPLRSCTVTRALDEAGSFALEVAANDVRAVEMLTNKRRLRLFRYDPPTGLKRELGRGIIEKVSTKDSASGWTRSVSGPDNLAELKFVSVLLGRVYDTDTVNQIVDALLALTTGWTRSGSSTTSISARYDGVSLLKALQSLVTGQGLHFRQSSTAGTLEIGAFGADSGKRIMGAATLDQRFYRNDKVLLVDNFSLVEDSEDIVNWLLPIGAGRGEAAVTLEQSTRTTPYTIQNTTVNGRTLYYIKDSTSITANGQVQKVGTFKDVTPIGTSAQNLIDAGNALYDVAAAWLSRYKDKYDSYSVTCRNVQSNILPGDKIRIHYKGQITDARTGEIVDFRDINADFWILEVKETYNSEGGNVAFKIASVDRYAQSAEKIILGGLESIKVNGVVVEPTFNHSSYVYRREIDSTHTATVPLDISSATAQLIGCKIRLKTRPFRATATAAASGGSSSQTSDSATHDHIWSRVDSSPPGGSGSVKKFTVADGSGNTYWFEANTTVPTPTALYVIGNGSHAHSISIPAHTHNLSYGLYDDASYPTTVRISINGTDRTTALGGPWATGGGALDVVLEIADYINLATLQQLHSIVISCDSSQGECEATVDVWEIIQTIGVT